MSAKVVTFQIEDDKEQNTKKNFKCCWDFRQLGTTTTGVLIFLSAGMNLAQGYGWTYFNIDQFRYAWFIGAIAGTVLSPILRQFMLQKLILALSSLLILSEGIIYLTPNCSNTAYLAARYINGIAVGMATLTFLTHASEVALNAHRGVLLGFEHYALAVGISVQMMYSTKWNEFPLIRLHGILDIFLGLLAFLSIWIFTESPIRYFRKGNDEKALKCLDHLHQSQGWKVTTDILFNDMKAYVQEQINLTWLESFRYAIIPLLKMLLFRSMMLAFSFSLPLCTVLQYSTIIMWPQIIAAFLRIFGCYLAYLLVDSFGRKLPSLLSAASIGTLLLAIAIICQSDHHVFNSYKKFIVATLCLLTQFFSGLFAPFTSVYMSEAFPLKVKPYCMGLVNIMEHLIHIIVICGYRGIEHDNILMWEGILALLGFVILCFLMPETKRTSLRGAQELFRKPIHLKMYQYY